MFMHSALSTQHSIRYKQSKGITLIFFFFIFLFTNQNARSANCIFIFLTQLNKLTIASSSESGHAVNIANLKKLADACAGFGVKYNPSNTDITVANLKAKWTIVTTAQGVLTSALEASREPINQRAILFAPIDKLVTRSLNFLNSTKASAAVKKDAKGIADKIRGIGSTKKTASAPAADGTIDVLTVSNSQQSYVQKAENYLKYCELITTITDYLPNEVELQSAAMKALYTPMKDANDAIGTILAPVDQARLDRDHGLYDADSGVIDLAKACKQYVKALFGATSAEAKLVTGIKFSPKKKK